MSASVVFIYVMLPCLVTTGHVIQCKEKEYAQIGGNVSIDCNLDTFDEVYWYKDKTPSSIPLVKITIGQKTISEAAKGRYDITNKGALLLNNVTHEDYGKYTILCVYHDDSFDEYDIHLDAAVQPEQKCPSISNCSSCYCSLSPKANHNVTCHINGTRPLANVSFILQTTFNYTISFKEDISIYNNHTDTWDSRSSIGIFIPRCDLSIKIRCKVIEENHFNLRDSFVELVSDPCPVSITPTVSIEDSHLFVFDNKVIFIAVVVFALVFVCGFVIVCIAIQRNRNDISRHVTEGNNIDMESTKPLLDKPLAKENVDILIKHLQDRYNSRSYVKLIPGAQDVLIDKLYTGTTCQVTHVDGRNEIISSMYLLTSEISKPIKRALFIADHGHGKTTLCQYLASQWSKKRRSEQNQEILFILLLKDVDINTGIGEQIHKTLLSNIDITYKQLCNILQNKKCHVLLDGLDELSEVNVTKNEREEFVNDISIKRLLNEPTLHQYENLRLWVTSRDIVNLNCIYKIPSTKIKLSAFNDDEINKYIENTLNYYKKIKPVKNNSNDETYVSETHSVDNIPKKIDKQEISNVRSILDEKNLVADFKETPPLMVLFIHIVVAKLLGFKGTLFEININKLFPLVSSVIACLEQDIIDKPDNATKDLVSLRIKLGEASLNKLDKYIKIKKETLTILDIETCRSVGYLKPTNKHPLTDYSCPTSNTVEFAHDYIQEYCVAEYIARTFSLGLTSLLGFLSEDSNKRVSRIFTFAPVISAAVLQQALETLATGQYWNIYADCLYESVNNAEPNSYVSQESTILIPLIQSIPSELSMNVKDLDNSYHQRSFIMFIKCIYSKKIKFNSITFGSECSLDFLLELKLHAVHILGLRAIDLNKSKDKFVKIIIWAKKNNVKRIRFVACNVPNEITLIERNTDAAAGITIIRTCSDEKKEEILHIESGMWKKPFSSSS